MGQSQITRAQGAVGTVITNALIVDPAHIFKADVGLRDGRIHKVGKAGNPDTYPNVDIIIGPGTEIIASEGKILTEGGFDSHIHFICPQQIKDALHTGLTTMLDGGTGTAHRTRPIASDNQAMGRVGVVLNRIWDCWRDWLGPYPAAGLFTAYVGAFGRSVEPSAVTFVSGAAQAYGIREKLGLAKQTVAVKNPRDIGKKT